MLLRGRNVWLAGLAVTACAFTLLSEFTATAQSDQKSQQAEGAAEPKKSARQQLMDSKLAVAQDILRGVVLSDFKLVEKAGIGLNLLTLAEEWGFNNSKEYLRMSEDLRRISKQLVKAGRDKDADAAALAYQRMTLNCVECHQALRDGFK